MQDQNTERVAVTSPGPFKRELRQTEVVWVVPNPVCLESLYEEIKIKHPRRRHEDSKRIQLTSQKETSQKHPALLTFYLRHLTSSQRKQMSLFSAILGASCYSSPRKLTQKANKALLRTESRSGQKARVEEQKAGWEGVRRYLPTGGPNLTSWLSLFFFSFKSRHLDLKNAQGQGAWSFISFSIKDSWLPWETAAFLQLQWVITGGSSSFPWIPSNILPKTGLSTGISYHMNRRPTTQLSARLSHTEGLHLVGSKPSTVKNKQEQTDNWFHVCCDLSILQPEEGQPLQRPAKRNNGNQTLDTLVFSLLKWALAQVKRT